MKTDIWIVTTCIPAPGEKPCLPSPFATEEDAEAFADEMMRAEWATHGPDDDETGEPLPYPGNWQEAQDAILKWSFDGSWGQWQVTKHTIETPDAPHPAAAFIERMANFTTPEDEFADPERGIAAVHETVEDYVADLDDERLCSEFQTFMDMVREARTIRGAAPAPCRIVVTVKGGVAEVADAENWPAGLELYLVDYDNDDGGSHLDGPCAVNKYGDDTPQADGMTGHFAKNVAEAWEHD